MYHKRKLSISVQFCNPIRYRRGWNPPPPLVIFIYCSRNIRVRVLLVGDYYMYVLTMIFWKFHVIWSIFEKFTPFWQKIVNKFTKWQSSSLGNVGNFGFFQIAPVDSIFELGVWNLVYMLVIPTHLTWWKENLRKPVIRPK